MSPAFDAIVTTMFVTGIALTVPLFVKQNTGLGFLAAIATVVAILIAHKAWRRQRTSGCVWLLAGMAAGLIQERDDSRLHSLRCPRLKTRNNRTEALRLDIEIGGPEHLALVHRKSAGKLAQVLVGQKLRGQRLPPLGQLGAEFLARGLRTNTHIDLRMRAISFFPRVSRTG